MPSVDIDQAPNKAEPEISSACEAAATMCTDLETAALANPMDQALQKQNLEDLHLATDVFSSLNSFKLTPEDKKLLQELSAALRSPNRNLSDIRGKLQEADTQRTQALDDMKGKISASPTVNNKDVCRALDLENSLPAIRAANELARSAEVALGRNGVALKDAAIGMYAALVSGVSKAPGGLGPEFVARVNELGKAVDEFKPESMGVLTKEEATQLDNVRFALSGMPHPKAETGIEAIKKPCETLEQAAAKDSALEGAAKIAIAVKNTLTAFERLMKATESRLTVADAVRKEQISKAVSYMKENAIAGPNHQCATAVAKGIEAATSVFYGIPSPSYARQYGTVLTEEAHFTKVPNNSPQDGDIAIVQGWPGNPAGHAAMRTGNQWASEFLQGESPKPDFDPNLPYPAPQTQAASANYEVYRWPDPRVAFNKLDIGRQMPQEAIRRFVEFLDYCSHDPVAREADFNRIKNEVRADNVKPPR